MVNQKRKKILCRIVRTLTNIYWFGYCLREAVTLSEKKTDKGPTENVNLILKGYGLITRQLPPRKIKLLRNDVLVLYFFDYISYPPLQDNVTVDFDFKSYSKGSFYSIHENKKKPNQSHLIINASKISVKKPIFLRFKVSAEFKKASYSKTSRKYYSTHIQVIDKYITSKDNFQNFDEGFTMRMRSNDTGIKFPMTSNDILGNNINVTVREKNENLQSKRKVKVKVEPLQVTYNSSFYRRLENARMTIGLGLSLYNDAVISQRIDQPNKYQFQFINYTSSGIINIIEALTFNELEITSKLKINAYTHIATLNTENKASYMILMLTKMNPKDPLPLTHLFYPGYKLVYYKIGGPMYDASHAWENTQIIWVFKLSKPALWNNVGGEKTWTQKIEIYGIYLSNQAMRQVGEVDLENLKSLLDSWVSASYKNITCKEIETFSRWRAFLGCKLFNNDLNDSDSQQIHIIVQIKKDGENNLTFSIEDVISESESKRKHLVAKCLQNFWHTAKARSNHKYLIRPFGIIYHEPGSGYFMRSSNEEWVHLFNDTELSRDMKLMNTICQSESKTLILRYQKDIKGRRKINDELGSVRWSKVVILVINLNSKENADNRIITRIERDVAFALNSDQMFETFYIEAQQRLVIGNTGQLLDFNYHRLYYSTTIDLGYPRITISTNASQDFTADMKIFLDNKSEVKEGAYGFPFKIEAKTPQKFKLSPETNISALKNGKYNLEEFLNITGPKRSIQQVSEHQERIKLSSRLSWHPTQVPDADYIDIMWIQGISFFGITKKRFTYLDFQNIASHVSYTQKVISAIYCSSPQTISFYILHYDPVLINSLSVRAMDLVPSKLNKSTKILNSYSLVSIDPMIKNVHVASSKRLLKSVADGIVAVCIYDRNLVKIVMIDYLDKSRPVLTQMKDISTKSLGRKLQFSKVEIISMMTDTPELRSMLVVLGTTSYIFAQYAHYDPSLKNKNLKRVRASWPGLPSKIPLNASLEYLRCENATTTNSNNSLTKVSSRCMVVVGSYLMKSFVYKTLISKHFHKDNQIYFFSSPSYSFGSEYEIPRFYKVISVKPSPEFIAVHAVNSLNYHNEIFVYKRDRREVWSSIYSSYEKTVCYDIGIWKDSTTWLYMNELKTSLKLYFVGNMTMEVGGGTTRPKGLISSTPHLRSRARLAVLSRSSSSHKK